MCFRGRSVGFVLYQQVDGMKSKFAEIHQQARHESIKGCKKMPCHNLGKCGIYLGIVEGDGSCIKLPHENPNTCWSVAGCGFERRKAYVLWFHIANNAVVSGFSSIAFCCGSSHEANLKPYKLL